MRKFSAKLFLGALSGDLDEVIRLALDGERASCVAEARHYEWKACTDRVLEALAWCTQAGERRAAA